MDVEKVNPYDDMREKDVQVEEMFDTIAPAYDFMNNAMTLGLHRLWRNTALDKALSMLPAKENLNFLDVATGTGDLVFYLHSKCKEATITGIDLSAGMLGIAREKLFRLPESDRNLLAFGKADCLALPFHDGAFDLVTVAYGVRNFSDIEVGLREMRRVLKADGIICIIELSTPEGKITSSLYKIYSKKIIPAVGKMVSGDKSAYSYLPESIAACPQREAMADLMRKAGFEDVRWQSLTFGTVTYYLGK